MKLNNINRVIEQKAGWIFIIFGILILGCLGVYVVIGWNFLTRILSASEASTKDFITTIGVMKALWFYLCPSLAILLICSGILLLKKGSTR
jgi:hypothetical protein